MLLSNCFCQTMVKNQDLTRNKKLVDYSVVEEEEKVE